MLIPTRKQFNWWLMIGEITGDWVDIPPNSTIFETKEGRPLRTPPVEHDRLFLFDVTGQQQTEIDMDEEGGEQLDPMGNLSITSTRTPLIQWVILTKTL